MAPPLHARAPACADHARLGPVPYFNRLHLATEPFYPSACMRLHATRTPIPPPPTGPRTAVQHDLLGGEHYIAAKCH
jgi:hypothetical protein